MTVACCASLNDASARITPTVIAMPRLYGRSAYPNDGRDQHRHHCSCGLHHDATSEFMHRRSLCYEAFRAAPHSANDLAVKLLSDGAEVNTVPVSRLPSE